MHHIKVVAQKKIISVRQLPKYTHLVPIVRDPILIRHISTPNSFMSSIVINLRFDLFPSKTMEEDFL